MKVFLSYNFQDQAFVQRVSYYLRTQPPLEPFCYSEGPGPGAWSEQIEVALKESRVFVLFVGEALGETQEAEAKRAKTQSIPYLLVVGLPGKVELPMTLAAFDKRDPIRVDDLRDGAQQCAMEIVRRIEMKWGDPFGIPLGYPFDYEKDIIAQYVQGEGRLPAKYLELGCPESWPSVEIVATNAPVENPVSEEEIGKYRQMEESVIADVRSCYHCPREETRTCLVKFGPQPLTLPEAGPREKIRYPNPEHSTYLRVGVLVSGGIAPGINAVISGIVERHHLYQEKYAEKRKREGMLGYDLIIYGYRDGLKALLRPGQNYRPLDRTQIDGQANLGGSMLSTSRADELLDLMHPDARAKRIESIVQKLSDDGVEILYVIGGDGSMKAAHAIRMAAKARKRDISVVAIPKTMDNDVLWVWQSFGFLSAVQKAKEFILQLHTEAQSNPRLCIIQLFGSDSGFVVSHAALASGVCDLALIPEVGFSMRKVSKYICQTLERRHRPGQDGRSPYGVIVMSETAIPTDVKEYLDDPDVGLNKEEVDAVTAFLQNGRRVYGQTPDALRTGGLKIVSRILNRDIHSMGDPYWREFRVFTNEPRHLLRSIEPSVSDVIFGHRLGSLAVDNAMAGYTDFMVSQWLTEFVLVPLELVILGRKRVPPKGIFWKSVLASTAQPENLE